MNADAVRLLFRIRLLIGIVIAGLIVSGLTAFRSFTKSTS